MRRNNQEKFSIIRYKGSYLGRVGSISAKGDTPFQTTGGEVV